MGKYVNLNREEINQRVKELIAQYAEHSVELKLNSNNIYDKRQYEIWYGGEIAAFEYKSRYFVSIRATGDVKADLNDENGEMIIRVKDKQDNGRFYDEMQVYICDDETLDRYIGYDGKNWTGEVRLIIWDNNWLEAQIYDNKEGVWLDADCILIKSEGVLDIGYKDVVGYVDCCIDQYEARLKNQNGGAEPNDGKIHTIFENCKLIAFLQSHVIMLKRRRKTDEKHTGL